MTDDEVSEAISDVIESLIAKGARDFQVIGGLELAKAEYLHHAVRGVLLLKGEG